MTTPPYDHFEGKTVVDHLKEARARGAMASAEIHGTEMPGHHAAAADATKETTLALLIVFAISAHFFKEPKTLVILVLFSCGWLIWKTGRSALLGWARMERLHRVIEEERWEIEHHRQQEREELTELYRAKGLQGKLLEEVIDVLMADDNRLLTVMLEEELGLTLEAYEHPLKQASGAALGTFCSASLLLGAYFVSPMFGIPLMAGCLLIFATALAAKLERNRPLYAIVWNLALALLASGAVYFIGQLIIDG
ncbi:MAG: VIT1/CCC1 transporter family protein [Rhabdochlamydiaceae bacterium]|nr:VIT1/CCC1 transporter family protein [Rhabdochlamydiaceae bacterium]